MSAIGDRYRRRADAFEALINRTPPERWASPSPCDGWLAQDIVAHIVRHSAETLRDKAGVQQAEEVAVLWETLSAMPPEWWKWQVDNGHDAPPVHVPDDASLQQRLVALIGRDPRWTP
jgi:hypothetical protein